MSSFYKHGSDGTMNLFFRPKSLDYFVGRDMSPALAEKSYWIIQWEGNPNWDSGYSEWKFADYASAIETFEGMEQEEYPIRHRMDRVRIF